MDATDPSSATPPAAKPSAPPAPTWPRAVQSSLGVIVGALVVGLVAHSLLHANIQRPVAQPGEPPTHRIDVNRATRAELQLLPGVGAQLAERIEAIPLAEIVAGAGDPQQLFR